MARKNESLEDHAKRLYPDVWKFMQEAVKNNPEIDIRDLQDAVFRALGKHHLNHSFDIFLLAMEAKK